MRKAGMDLLDVDPVDLLSIVALHHQQVILHHIQHVMEELGAVLAFA